MFKLANLLQLVMAGLGNLDSETPNSTQRNIYFTIGEYFKIIKNVLEKNR